MPATCKVVDWHNSNNSSIERTSAVPKAFECINARRDDEENAMAAEVTAVELCKLAVVRNGDRDRLIFQVPFTSCERGI